MPNLVLAFEFRRIGEREGYGETVIWQQITPELYTLPSDSEASLSAKGSKRIHELGSPRFLRLPADADCKNRSTAHACKANQGIVFCASFHCQVHFEYLLEEASA
jgi:hypothetical protein